ncbi:MAG: CusA/CzcA family heavy metal efflux RND transporter [Bacteroidota bacterium]
MLDRIILYSIRNKTVIGLLTFAMIVWGGYSITQLPIDAVPDITNNQVQIITLAQSQSALDIERLVTFPVEQTMATIPGISEIRSISRFGLSVVTIVFKDEIDIYWARQQVNERLSIAAEQIPNGVGRPELAPLTTGLGEIFQYIIRPKKGYEEKYTVMELRTAQDWIVRRQLLGTEGIADVASFGGLLKQYEIALDPDKLRSYSLGIPDVFEALRLNNQNTGGAYIDKKPNAYFIRSEGLIQSQADIGKIIIKTTSKGIPVLIRDVADIRFGNAIRYGAMTYNGKSEVVGGIVLMLKGENSNAVVSRVKEKMLQVNKSLPEGLEIEGFLDRSALVKRAIGTVERNLIEGALIVIAVLVLFLGNIRAGLIVASVIPLAMLFAISFMHMFGVSGNLMSLGAIDFGLIVDGAVIIVEATMHHLGMRGITQRLTQPEMDEEVHASASKVMTSAAFGEIIILIVYLPLLVLVGVEGKMFTPMAQAVAFAIVGAFILSLTYVPMMSALFLSKETQHKRSFSDKMMDFFYRAYRPIIRASIHHKTIVIISAVALFAVSIFIFLNMGGEFLPTLDEGDFAVETRVLTGSSLSYTTEIAEKASALLLKEFPDEIKEVVAKVGTSEIPVDPMPIDMADLIVVLNPRDTWKKASNREELANKMGKVLSVFPSATFGFQQPIQMRFNELISGIRQDVAVKIFGEDLETLSDLSRQVGKIVNTVKGARDLYVEEVTGLPQIVIDVDRDAIARYGLNIARVNEAINTAFAGQSAGLVYEGERRFDLVVRLALNNRQDIDDVRNLFITTPDNHQVPLSQLAKVEFQVGPNQVQREDAKRRIIVGFNVRGRDVASVVEELRSKIDQQIKFPAGYYPTYGGQFENLQQAKSRLSVAVPAALGLIFVLLFFTFHSMKQSLLIFSAIPMAAIGGVFALLLRGMPFSISAGVGFIALFGVAVLNGIVLIAEFNRLKKEGMTDIEEIVMKGTFVRLRPVLMTASVASLGFLPMALATSSGAEVQRPLATVVIGGLVTSTLLTLVVLPCLYIAFEKIKFRKTVVAVLALMFVSFISNAQQLSVEQAVDKALENNKGIQAASLEVDYFKQSRKTSSDVGKMTATLMKGQYNSYASDHNITLTQSIPFPTVFTTQRSLGNALIEGATLKKAANENELAFQVKQICYQMIYLAAKEKLLVSQDSMFEKLVHATDVRYRTGESKLLEKTTAETQRDEIRNSISITRSDILIYQRTLQTLTGSEEPVSIATAFSKLKASFSFDTTSLKQNPQLRYLQQQVAIAEGERKVTNAKVLPDIVVGYFNQSLIGTLNDAGEKATSGTRFTGVMLGVSIPLWLSPQVARVKAARINEEKSQKIFEYNQSVVEGEWQRAVQEYLKNVRSVEYYETSASLNADLILRQSDSAFRNGEIGYTEYWLAMRNAIQIKESYLSSLNNLNQSVINLEFLAGIK